MKFRFRRGLSICPPRYEIKDPRQDETDDHELAECLGSVNDPLAGRPRINAAENDRDEEGECRQVDEVDHFFLPTAMSTASMAAR